MKTTKATYLKLLWKPLLALIALAAMVIWTTGLWTQRVEPGVVPHAPGLAPPDGAEIYTVQHAAEPGWVEVVGTVTSDNKLDLGALISAYVTEIHVSAGDRVEAGDLLLKLDDRELRTQQAAAQADLHRAKTEYERIHSLHERQAATEQQWIAAEAGFHAAQARFEQTEVSLSFTEIRSPLTGRVADRHVEIGTLAHPGQRLVTVYDTAAMRLDAPVPVRLVERLALEMPAPVQLELPDRTLTGRVSRIVAEIDPRSRTRTVQVRLEAPDDTPLLPGTFGRLRVPTADRTVLAVPASALVPSGQLDMVQVVQQDRVLRRLVKTGRAADGRVEILSGLQGGERILLQPITDR